MVIRPLSGQMDPGTGLAKSDDTPMARERRKISSIQIEVGS